MAAYLNIFLSLLQMEELDVSELGSREYWENRYKDELNNFEEHGELGEIWFGEDIGHRILKWLNKKSVPKSSKILDVGCGNGMFLIELCSDGFTDLSGIDYSDDAIKLAKSISETRSLKIAYSTCDILNGLDGQFDIIHDKGTYDAMCLNANINEFRPKYLNNIWSSLIFEGLFIITSCNWTKDELNQHFQPYFACIDSIPTPQFTFGGETGNTVTSLIYKKKNNVTL